MNSCTRFLLATASLFILQSAVLAQSSVKADINLMEKVVSYYGTKEAHYDISAGGMAFNDYFMNINCAPPKEGFITWRVIPGYNRFTCYVGCDDGSSYDYRKEFPSDTIELFLDGTLYRSYEVFPNQRAIKVDVPVSEVRSIKMTVKGAPSRGIIAEPRLTAGSGGQAAVVPESQAPLVTNYPSGNSMIAAPFAVSSKDMNELAQKVRKTVESNPALQARIDRSQIALASFDLIDINSKSVAKMVVEDLSTAMIKAGFRLVERGQLETVLKELKIQNTGAMDPRTVQRVGVLSGCDVVMVGSISDRGQYIVINCRLLETATAKGLAAEQQEMPKVTLNR